MPIIYICVWCKARTQTNTRRPLQAGEMGTPSPRSEQLHTMGNHTRTASGRTTTATPSPTIRAASRHEQPPTPNDIRAQTSTASGRAMGAPSSPAGTPHALNRAPIVSAGYPRPPGWASEYTYKFRLTFIIPMDCSAAVALSRSRFAQNHNSL